MTVAFIGFMLATLLVNLSPPLVIIGIIVSVLGCYWWATGKNRHWAFMLWGILVPIGFLGVALLRNKSEEIAYEETFEQTGNQIVQDGGPDEKIRKLAELRDEGILTEDEFKQKKSQIVRDSDYDEKIKKLAELRDEGILTEDEFERKKSQVVRDSDSDEKIKKLAELRDEGILTEDEFERKKSQILKSSS
jgi:Fic family protein